MPAQVAAAIFALRLVVLDRMWIGFRRQYPEAEAKDQKPRIGAMLIGRKSDLERSLTLTGGTPMSSGRRAPKI
jgi:hypothetical protein